MIFTLTDREYNVLDAYETEDYLIGSYIGSIIKTLDINILVKSDKPAFWKEGNYIFCEDSQGYKHWFTIYDYEDGLNDNEKKLTCYSGTIDIVSEDSGPITRPTTPQPFSYYFNKIFYDTGIVIGKNEIADSNRTLEFTSEEATNAEMLQFVLNGFNAEGDLAVEFKGSVPTKIVLNVFKRIGSEIPQTILTDEDESLIDLERTGSISDMATCLNPTGKDGEEGQPAVTLAGKYYEELDENGEILYYSPLNDHRVYSLKAKEMFFVKIPGKQNGEFDGYINRRYKSEAATKDSLWTESLIQLKKIDHPTVTYEAKGSIDCQIGDTIQIVSHEMKPAIMISARVLEYKFNDDDPTRNEYKFGNYQDLESNIDDLSKLMAEIKKNIITIVSQNTEYSISTQGITIPLDGWVVDLPAMKQGDWLWVRTTTVLSNGDKPVSYSVSYAGINAYSMNLSSEVHTVPADSEGLNMDFTGAETEIKVFNGTNEETTEWTITAQPGTGVTGNFKTNVLTRKVYQITNLVNDVGFVDFVAIKGSKTLNKRFSLSKTKEGQRGLQGLQGEDGSQGLPGSKGADGKDSYTHIAYANSADGVTGFSVSDSLNKLYIGMYADNIATDSTNPAAYLWTLIKGADGTQGIPGTKGADGQTPYLHIAYATNITGTAGFSTTVSVGKTHIGQYTDFLSTDSSDPTKYLWTLVKGDKGDTGPQGPPGLDGLQGEDGSQGLPGAPGADGKSSYTHIAYANSADGTSGFSTSVSTNKLYIGMYVDFNATDSSTPSMYNWTLIKGADGSQGIPGVKGNDGQTSYLHIAYATNATGTTGFSTTVSAGKTYIGQYTDFVSTDSSDPTKYLWTLIKGEKGDTGAPGTPGTNGSDGATGPAGQNAITGYLTNESLVVTADNAGTVASFSAANGYFRVMDGNNQATSGMVFSLVSSSGITTSINSTGYFSVTAMSADFGTATFRAVYKGITVDKIMMIVKNKQGPTGPTGSTGSTGSPGANGVGITTTAVTYQASSSGTTTPTGTWTTTIPAVAANQYLWTRTITNYTSGTPTTAYSIGKMGANGSDGANGSNGATGPAGTGISSTAVTYQASTSGTTVPTGSWLSSVPNVAQGQYLWTRTILTLTNGSTTTAYSIGRIGEQGPQGPSGTNGSNGATGPAGPPTGIIEQSAEPALSTRYVGMLWRDTDDGIVRKWNGSAWGIFLFHADNISATNLAAITANLGTVTAGKISGSGTNGSLALDLATGKISTAASRVIGQNTYTTTLETYGGRVSSTETTAGGTEYVSGILDGAQLTMGRYSAGGAMIENTTITPKGFQNQTASSGRLIEFTAEGMKLSPSLGNTGNSSNSGIELVGNISYIDFHNTPTPTDDFTARIVCNYPAYGAKRLVIQNLVEDVRIQTFGNLHVMDGQGTSYREVRASKLNPQSAHSAKKDFTNIDQSELLNAVEKTEIVKYRMKYETEEDKMSIGFIINDDGLSPYETSDLFVATNGQSFDLTTSTGILIGAVKELSRKIKILEDKNI